MITPGWTTATVSATEISRMRFIRARLRQIEPSTGTAPPASPVAEPRGTTGTRRRVGDAQRPPTTCAVVLRMDDDIRPRLGPRAVVGVGRQILRRGADPLRRR